MADSSAIDFDQDMRFQRRSWKVQRFGRWIMCLVVALALLGLFGDGPLSRAKVVSQNSSIQIQYDRFARMTATQTLTLRLHPDSVHDGKVRVWIHRSLIPKIQILTITPTPLRTESAGDQTNYEFSVTEANRDAIVTMQFQSLIAGIMHCQMGIESGDSVAFSVFVYP